MKKLAMVGVAGCLLMIGCRGGGGPGLDTNPGGTQINTSVSGTPSPSLFDVWTITIQKQAGTTCPSNFTSAQEEYVVQLVTGNECQIEDELVNGDDLVNDELLFDEENTTCRAGGNAIGLESQKILNQSENCSVTINTAARLDLVGNALNGNYEAIVHVSDGCPADIDNFRNCSVLVSLVGTRGRHAPDNQDHPGLMLQPIWVSYGGEYGGEEDGTGGSGTAGGGTTGGGETTTGGSTTSGGTSGGTDGSGTPPADETHEFITFTDTNLAAKVRVALGLAADADIPRASCAGLTELNASFGASTPSSGRVVNLSGIENCTGLKKLYLNYNNITDLSPLASLTALEELEVFNNNFGNTEKLRDISPLSGLTSLKVLKFFNNYVRNLSPLAGLTSLEGLYIGYNAFGVGFESLSPLSSLTSLKRLQLCGNYISDITPLAGLTNLEYLDLLQNEISNLTPIENLVELDVLQLWTNDINGLNSLATLHENGGLGAGDVVTIKGNPIETEGAMGTLNGEIIDELEADGITVSRDAGIFP